MKILEIITNRNILRNQALNIDLQLQASSLSFQRTKQNIATRLHGISEKSKKGEDLERVTFEKNNTLSSISFVNFTRVK